MRRTLFLLLVCLPWLGPAPAAADEEIAVDMAWASSSKRAYPSRSIELEEDPPDGVDALESGGEMRYGKVPFAGDRKLLVAVDLTRGKSKLWIDQDFDGQLKDQKPFLFPAEKSIRVTKAIVHLPLALEGEPEDLSVRIDFSLAWLAKKMKETLNMTVRAHRTGTVLLEGRARDVWLENRGADLRVDTAQSGLLYVDLNGDGNLSRDDLVEIGVPFRLRDRGYVARVLGATGRRVTFFETKQVPPPRTVPLQRPHIPRSGYRGVLQAGAFEKAKADYESAVERQAAGKRVRLSRYLQRIGKAGTKEAFLYLQKVYKSSRNPSYVKVAAITAMGNGHFVEFAPRLSQIARSARDPIVTIAAVRALHFMGDPERENTYAVLLRRGKDPAAFKIVAEHLAYPRTETAQQILEEALAKESNPDRLEVLYRAAMHFGEEPPSRERVLAFAGSEKERLRMLALKDAMMLGMPDLPALAMTAARKGVKDAALRALLVEILGRRGDALSLSVLMPLLPEAGHSTRQRFATLLATLRDPAAAEVLVSQLGHREAAVRSLVLAALARIPGDRIRDAIRDRFKPERTPEVVAALMRAAGGHRDERAGALVVAAARRLPREGTVQAAAIEALSRIGFDDPCVAEFFAERLAKTEGEVRMDIIEAAADSGHPGAGPVLATLLVEPDWDIRYAAAQALGRLRAKSAIAALIEVLRDERNTRVRRTVAHTLFLTTGQYLQDDFETWQRWWERHGKDFNVPTEIPSLPESPEDRPYATTFYGVPVETKKARVVFVLDKSGSMASEARWKGMSEEDQGMTELDRAMRETLKVIAKLDDNARINVIFFESSISSWSRKLQPLTRKTRRDVKTFVMDHYPTGATNLYDGLEMALDTKGVETIYLLSDGQPSAGRLRGTDEITGAVRKINRKRRIVIHCVSLGRSSKLLKLLAEQNGGIYVRI